MFTKYILGLNTKYYNRFKWGRIYRKCYNFNKLFFINLIFYVCPPTHSRIILGSFINMFYDSMVF